MSYALTGRFPSVALVALSFALSGANSVSAQGASPTGAPEAPSATADAASPPPPAAEPMPPPPPVTVVPAAEARGSTHVNLAVDDGIHRQGFTLQLSLGVAWVKAFGAEQTKVALGGLNLELGGFISEDVAVVAKIVAANPMLFDEADAGIVGAFGVAGQFWLSDNAALTAGLGFAFVGASSGDAVQLGAPLLGFNWFPIALKRHGLGLAVEITPGFTKDISFVAYQVGFAWQYY
jgi:hypothetical protein